MGSSTYSDDVHHARAATRAATNTPTFKHDADVKSGVATSVLHPLLDIKGKDRESRDSAAHPRSKAIVVMFDHTGSMGEVPVLMQKKLPGLMALLVGKNYCEHPQVLFGAVGDCYDGSQAPLQIGQFESGNEMDDAFAAMAIERSGGGTQQESYEMAMYYFARHAKMDCLERRGEKGYMFLIGDEAPYPNVDRAKVKAIVGDDLEADVSTAAIAAELLEKFEVFFLIPSGTSYYDSPRTRDPWVRLLGAERVIKLADPSTVCEVIASTVGLMEGAVDADRLSADLADVGASRAAIASVSSSLDGLARSTSLAKVGTGTLPERVSKSNTSRL